MTENPSPPETSSTSSEASPSPQRVPQSPLSLLHRAKADVLREMAEEAEAQSKEATLPPSHE